MFPPPPARSQYSVLIRVRVRVSVTGIRQDMAGKAGYGSIRQIRQDTAGYGRIRQDTAAYGSIRQDTAGYGRIRQDTTGYGRIRILQEYSRIRETPITVCLSNSKVSTFLPRLSLVRLNHN